MNSIGSEPVQSIIASDDQTINFSIKLVNIYIGLYNKYHDQGE